MAGLKLKADESAKEIAKLQRENEKIKTSAKEVNNLKQTIRNLRSEKVLLRKSEETKAKEREAFYEEKLEQLSSCQICLERFDDNERTSVKLRCPHVLCKSCAHALEPKMCPFCRTKFYKNQINRIILYS